MDIDYMETTLHLEWLKEKLRLNNNATSAQRRIVKRGEVYDCDFGVGIGSEERKKRPCVILQNNTANKNSGIVLVAPISHTYSNSPVVVPITTQTDSNGLTLLDGYVLIGNMMSVSKARLGNKISIIPPSEIKDIEKAILIQVGLWDKFNRMNNDLKDKEFIINNLKKKLNQG